MENSLGQSIGKFDTPFAWARLLDCLQPFAVNDIIAVTECNVLLSRSFGDKSSQKMTFPHPKAGKDDHWNCDKPNNGGVVRKLLIRTVNVTNYRNAKDDVNAAKNRTFGSITNHLTPFH